LFREKCLGRALRGSFRIPIYHCRHDGAGWIPAALERRGARARARQVTSVPDLGSLREFSSRCKALPFAPSFLDCPRARRVGTPDATCVTVPSIHRRRDDLALQLEKIGLLLAITNRPECLRNGRGVSGCRCRWLRRPGRRHGLFSGLARNRRFRRAR